MTERQVSVIIAILLSPMGWIFLTVMGAIITLMIREVIKAIKGNEQQR